MSLADRDRLLEAFVSITDRELRHSIVDAVIDAAFLDSVVSGGADTYLRIEGIAAGKPESKAPAGVQFVRHVRFATRTFRRISGEAGAVADRLDVARECHDHGKVVDPDDDPEQEAKQKRKTDRVRAHLRQKLAGAIAPAGGGTER